MAKTKKANVTAFNQAARAGRYEEVKGREGKEVELWQRWKQEGQQDKHLIPLMTSMEPLVRAKARAYAAGYGGALPKGAVEAKLRQYMLKGIKSYDPEGGAKLKTHVFTQFQRYSEDAAKGRNFARMSKSDTQNFQEYQNALNELRVVHGREPSAQELQHHLQWPGTSGLNQVTRMQRSIRKELFTGMDPNRSDMDMHEPSQIRTIISMAPSLLNEEENKVLQAMYPKGQLSTKDFDANHIATKTGLRPDRVYRVRSRIFEKLKPYLDKT